MWLCLRQSIDLKWWCIYTLASSFLLVTTPRFVLFILFLTFHQFHWLTLPLSISPSPPTVSFKTILYFRSLYYSNNIPRPYFWTYSRLTLTAFKMKNPTYCHNETTHECSLLQLDIGNIYLIINHSLTLGYTIVVELLISLMWQASFSFVCLRLKLY